MKKLRCAIYTRKSSEEGLDQAFNSLDAQREACEAYILSQKSEGWTALPAMYDDGGYSGGTMARPALERLLADIESGLVDVVVVYKVDRLTRSLPDFARIVEIFDRSGASFVSVTQSFNTTSSMGRLTLNVLLSFAQFEREVTGERIRDKIAASKAKGMWMGGYPPLGYEVENRNLAVVPPEAETVRHILERYLAHKSVAALADELEETGIVSKCRTSQRGITRGGTPFSRGALFHLLRNRLYIGEIVHGDKSYPGQHQAIVDLALFDEVQKTLKANAVVRKERRAIASPLTGLIFDAAGSRMSPTHAAGRSGSHYRYYVSTELQTGRRGKNDGRGTRVVAAVVEELVVERLRALSGKPAESWPALLPLLRRVEVRERKLVLEVVPTVHNGWLRRSCPEDELQVLADESLRVSFAALLKPRGGDTIVRLPPGGARKARYDRPLISALKRAHRELESKNIRFAGTRLDVGEGSGLGDPYLRRIAPLAFLAPDIQRCILEGRQPSGLTLKRLIASEIPLDWSEQRDKFGF